MLIGCLFSGQTAFAQSTYGTIAGTVRDSSGAVIAGAKVEIQQQAHPPSAARRQIVGAGILGLAHAYVAASRGDRIAVFERRPRALGASVRNFEMIWPIGQPNGEMHATAMRSRELWVDVLQKARLPHFPTGSLHVTYRADETAVAREFAEIAPSLGYECQRWKSPES